MRKNNYGLLILTLVILLSGIGVFLKGLQTHGPVREAMREAPESTKLAAPLQAMPTGPGVQITSGLATPGKNPFSDNGLRRESAWKRFQEKFGWELKAEFTPDGQLTSIRGETGQGGGQAGADFHPEDPRKSIARAREILDAARELLGTETRTPLEDPIARGSPVSAQVTFHEKVDGVPVEPYGNVTVDIGPRGELLGLDSTYLRKLRAVNTPLMKSDQARAVVMAQMAEAEGGLQLEGGNRVVWVSAPRAEQGQVLARHAYGFFYHGQQLIVDAADGKILSRRDQRNY